MIRNYFICSTKYQLFNCCNIIHEKYNNNNNENILLIIILNNELSNELFAISKKSKLFTDIKLVNIGVPTYYKKISLCFIKYYLNLLFKIFFSNTLIEINDYNINNVFITFTDVFSRIIAYKIICKYNSNLYFYEDGIASYLNVISSKAYNLKNKLLCRRFGFFLIEKCKGLYIYEPTYLVDNPYNINIFKISKLNVSGNYEKNLYKIMSLDGFVKTSDTNYIYYDGYFNDEKYNEKSLQLINIIANEIDKSLYIKHHPSKKSSQINFLNCKIYNYKDSSEITNLVYSQKNKILISNISTACVTPKIIYNEEPIVILLYKLFDNYKNIWGDLDLFFMNVKLSYSNQNNFFIPETIDDLKIYLKNINGNY